MPVTEVTTSHMPLFGYNRLAPGHSRRELDELFAADGVDGLAMASALASLEEDVEIRILVGEGVLALSVEASQAVREILKALLLVPEGTIRLRVTRDSAYLSPEAVAQQLGVSRPFVYKLLDRGDLPSEQVGKHRRVPAGAVAEYVRAQEAHTALVKQMAADALRSDHPEVEDGDLRSAVRQARQSGDLTVAKTVLRARRTARVAGSLRSQASGRWEE